MKNEIIFFSDVNRNTTEVLLELFDHVNKSNRFLGLGIVGVEELLVNPSQRQIIPLQGKPYDEDEITGTLVVEVRLLIFCLFNCNFSLELNTSYSINNY